jgi:hypothetical protein
VTQDNLKCSLKAHIKSTSKKVEGWPDWQKKVIEQRVVANNKPFGSKN